MKLSAFFFKCWISKKIRNKNLNNETQNEGSLEEEEFVGFP